MHEKKMCVSVLKFHSTSEPLSLFDDHGAKVSVSPDVILNCYRGGYLSTRNF